MRGSGRLIGLSNLSATAPKTRAYAISLIMQPLSRREWSSEKTGCSLPGGNIAARTTPVPLTHERDVVSVRLNQALARLGYGWMLHVDAVRCPVNPYSARGLSHFPTGSRGDRRRKAEPFLQQPGTAYESRFVLCVSYLPPDGAVKKLSEVIYDDDATTKRHESRGRKYVGALRTRARSPGKSFVQQLYAPPLRATQRNSPRTAEKSCTMIC